MWVEREQGRQEGGEWEEDAYVGSKHHFPGRLLRLPGRPDWWLE